MSESVEPGRLRGGGGEGESATFYDELRTIANRMFLSERRGHTLQPTAVVNEAFLRMHGSGLPDVGREERLAIAARVLKQVLIDHARSHNAQKRGGGREPLRLELDRELAMEEVTLQEYERVHAALERLGSLNERQAEVVTLRIFSGMSLDQIAGVLGVSKRTAEGDWAMARAWLRRELASGFGGASS